MFEAIAKSARVAAHNLRVRSALNPMLWLTAIALPACLSAAYFFAPAPFIQVVLVAVGILPVVCTCVWFAYFALKSPEKLQSEDYQLRHESLQFLQAKSGRIVVKPSVVAAIANPALPELPAPTADEA